MTKEYSIIYMGTPDFAVGPLSKLLDKFYKIDAVVTVADKPSGRGLKMHSSPVKEFALQHNIPVLQPVKMSDPEFIEQLKQINADLFIVVAFRKLPESVWKLPKLGCFNLHASLLPQYRGAAPINHAVINGESVTGVTTFFLNDQIDTGKIIMQRQTSIGRDETAGELHDRLMVIGADLVTDTVEAIFRNTATTVDQSIPESQLSGIELKKAPKIFRHDCRINWENNALQIHNFIRGLSPYPGSYSVVNTSDGENELKVLKSSLTGISYSGKPGEIKIENGRLYACTKDDLIELLIVQPSGKKPMPSSDFLRGLRSELISFH